MPIMKANNVALLCFLVATVGCVKPARDPQAGEPATPPAKQIPHPKNPELTPAKEVPQPEKPKQKPLPTKPAVEKKEWSEPAKTTAGLSPKEVSYLNGVLKFVEESRSALRLLELIPRDAAYKNRMERLQEDFIRIPDPPESMKEFHEQRVKRIFLLVRQCGNLLETVEKLARLDAKKEAIELMGHIQESVAKVREILDNLETVIANTK